MAQLDFLDCLANELIRLTVIGSGSIFVGKQPETPDKCVSIFGQTGSVVQQQRDVPGLQFPRFQVICRAKTYNEAADLAQAVRGVLHGMISKLLPHGVNTTTTSYIRILRCHIEYEGGPIGEDPQGRFEFSANYLAEYHHVTVTPEP